MRLREWIINGQLKRGEKLPSELKLCRLMQISRYAVRTALGRLQYEGLVEKVQGSGTYVREPVTNGDFNLYRDLVRLWPTPEKRVKELLRYRAAQVMLAVGSLLRRGRRVARPARRLIDELREIGSVGYTRDVLRIEEWFWGILGTSTGNLAMDIAANQLRRLFESLHTFIPEGDQTQTQVPVLRAFVRAVRAGDSFKAYAFARYALKQRTELYLKLFERLPPPNPSSLVDVPSEPDAISPEDAPPNDFEDWIDAPADPGETSWHRKEAALLEAATAGLPGG
ncbi:MAG: GntR family transcriptional regulator [Myxococcaceae bacterium]